MSYSTLTRHPHLFKLAFVVALTGISILQAPACAASDTLRVGSKVLVVGDPLPRVIDLLGQPLYTQPVFDSYGVYQGDHWFYRTDSSYITLLVVGGKLVNIDEKIERQ
jgi:hypothetical protein